MSRLYHSKDDQELNNTTPISLKNKKIKKKRDYKLYVLSDHEGLVYNFEVHSGKIEVCLNQLDIGPSVNIILKLLEDVERYKGHKIFVDNWYTGIPLATIMMKDGILLSGTIGANRLTTCTFLTDRELKNE